MMKRRHFLQSALASTLFPTGFLRADSTKPLLFDISLAQWSLHRAHRSRQIDNLEFAKLAKQEFGISAVEYVSQLFPDKGSDPAYLAEMKKISDDHGVTNVLIMVDREGNIGAATEEGRQKTIDNHKKWVEAAKFLGCHSIRVNAYAEGDSEEEQTTNAIKGLHALSTFAQDFDINVIVENHGGLSSNGKWMAKVLKEVGLANCGSLPDFGNFHDYDRYLGLEELMPFAKGVSAKSNDFDREGNEIHTDYRKALKIVLDAGFHGYVGIEYEGKTLGEFDGIKATKILLEKVRDELSA